jgi:hypothetical protein
MAIRQQSGIIDPNVQVEEISFDPTTGNGLARREGWLAYSIASAGGTGLLYSKGTGGPTAWTPVGVTAALVTDSTLQGAGTSLSPLANAVGKLACAVVSVTNIALSGVQTIDGMLLSVGQRVLVAAQTDPTTNGIYVVASGAWTRAADFATASQMINCQVAVVTGTVYGGSIWVFTTNTAITVGTTALVWSQVLGSGALSGLTLAQARLSLRPQYFSQVSGASVQTITLTGLNGNLDGNYKLVGRLVNGHSGAAYTFLPNSQTSNLNGAGLNPFVGGAGSLTGYWPVAVGNSVGQAGISVNCSVLGTLQIKTGSVRFFNARTIYGDSALAQYSDVWGTWTDTSTNMTSFQWSSSQTDGFAAGSYLQLIALGE